MYLEPGKVHQVVVVNKQYAKVVLKEGTSTSLATDDNTFAAEDDADFKPDFGSKSDNYKEGGGEKPEDDRDARRKFFMERIQNQASHSNTKFFSIGSVDSFERRMDEAQK
jgi:hypothetical protein